MILTVTWKVISPSEKLSSLTDLTNYQILCCVADANHNITPFQLIHSYIIKLPPPNFTIPCTNLSLSLFPTFPKLMFSYLIQGNWLYFYLTIQHSFDPAKCHTPQVALLGHFWSHWCPHRNFWFSIFPIITGNWPKMDAMRLREVAAYGRSYTECPSFPF